MPALATPTSPLEFIPLAKLQESPSNPRKHFDPVKLKELAASIRDQGVLQPALVREISPGSYELVFGHRRFRAAKLSGLQHLPCFVRVLGDRDVLELQLAENLRRDDLHPLEECDGYRQLRDEHELSVDEISAKTGHPKSRIYQRLQLEHLTEPSRKAWQNGKITAGVALLVARVVDPKLQAEALKEALPRKYENDSEPISMHEAVARLSKFSVLELKKAAFDVKDIDLVPAAGSCVKCPKRSGNNPDLFGDIDGKDVCTDRSCYELKCAADWKVRSVAAEAKGLTVLSEKESKKVFSEYGHLNYNSGYRDLADKEWVGNGNKQAPLRKLLGKECPPVVLARGPDGQPHELVSKQAVEEVLKQKAPEPSAVELQDEKARQAERKKQQLRERVVAVAAPRAVKAAEKTDLPRLFALAVAFCANRLEMYGEESDELIERWGAKTQEGLEAMAYTLELPKLKSLFVDLALTDLVGFHDRGSKLLQDVWDGVGVDLKAIEKEVKVLPERKCCSCSCTEDHACKGGCSWIKGATVGGAAADVCSRCEQVTDQAKKDFDKGLEGAVETKPKKGKAAK